MSTTEFRQWWDRCFRDLALVPSDGMFTDLVRRYSEPQRAYHTLQHIGECLGWFETVRDAMASLSCVGVALWFHDAIYDPRAQDNEARSAVLAHSELAANGASDAVTNSVESMILGTRTRGLRCAVDGRYRLANGANLTFDSQIYAACLTSLEGANRAECETLRVGHRRPTDPPAPRGRVEKSARRAKRSTQIFRGGGMRHRPRTPPRQSPAIASRSRTAPCRPG